ncbi:MAG: site-2 protease family protein [bacterium]|nr:site-2 protease family protein [bacterium]
MPYTISFTIVLIAIILLSFSVHELSHAWMANRLGDPTARLEGRISLNPLAHWDPIGTTMLVILILLKLPAFGWGKPVPINDRNFRNPNRDLLLSSLSGPISNILLAIFFGIIVRIFIPETNIFYQILILAITINIYLAIFNLIPLPPLDGSQILRAVAPPRTYEIIEANSMFFLIGLIILVSFAPGVIFSIVTTIVQLIV